MNKLINKFGKINIFMTICLVISLTIGYFISGLIIMPNLSEESLVPVRAQDVDYYTFIKGYGGSNTEKGSMIEQLVEGGYIISGWSNSYDSTWMSMLLTKVSYLGYVDWSKIISIGDINIARAVQQTADGGFILFGETMTLFQGLNNLALVKLNSTGDLEWAKTIGDQNNNIGMFIRQTTDQGFIAVGYTEATDNQSNDIVIKLDANGYIEWAKSIGQTLNDDAVVVFQTLDGGYAVLGNTKSEGVGGYDIILTKLDLNGIVLWSKIYGSTGDDIAISMSPTQDNGHIITAYTKGFGPNTDYLLIKVDVNGTIEWSKKTDVAGNEYGSFVRQVSDDGYVVAGYVETGDDDSDISLIKYDASGNLLWAKIAGGSGRDVPYAMAESSDGYYVVTGETSSFNNAPQLLLAKYDQDGSIDNCSFDEDLQVQVEVVVLQENSILLTAINENLNVSNIIATVETVSLDDEVICGSLYCLTTDKDTDYYDDFYCGGNDCDDSNSAINPGVLEICEDGIDQDCNGQDLLCSATCLPTDLSCNEVVDVEDLNSFLQYWSEGGVMADFNQDNVVSAQDLGIIMSAWGQ